MSSASSSASRMFMTVGTTTSDATAKWHIADMNASRASVAPSTPHPCATACNALSTSLTRTSPVACVKTVSKVSSSISEHDPIISVASLAATESGSMPAFASPSAAAVARLAIECAAPITPSKARNTLNAMCAAPSSSSGTTSSALPLVLCRTVTAARISSTPLSGCGDSPARVTRTIMRTESRNIILWLSPSLAS